MRVDLIGLWGIVAALHAAKANVVGGLRVAHRQGEVGLEHGIRLLPVHVVANVNTLCLRAFVETDILGDGRFSESPVNAQGLAERAVLHDLHAYVPLYGLRLLVERLLQDFPCGPCV